MSYGMIVKELGRLLDPHIIAFDNLPDRGGCVLYLDGPVRRIEVQRDALDIGAREVAAFVRQLIEKAPQTISRVGVHDGKLVLLDKRPNE